MMNVKKRLRKELKLQQKLEGFSDETVLLLAVLDITKTSLDWQALAVRYDGPAFGPTQKRHRFHRPTPLLLALKDFFCDKSPWYEKS